MGQGHLTPVLAGMVSKTITEGSLNSMTAASPEVLLDFNE